MNAPLDNHMMVGQEVHNQSSSGWGCGHDRRRCCSRCWTSGSQLHCTILSALAFSKLTSAGLFQFLHPVHFIFGIARGQIWSEVRNCNDNLVIRKRCRLYFITKASFQQVQASAVLHSVTFVWKASILVLQSPVTLASIVMSAQASAILLVQFFSFCPFSPAVEDCLKI